MIRVTIEHNQDRYRIYPFKRRNTKNSNQLFTFVKMFGVDWYFHACLTNNQSIYSLFSNIKYNYRRHVVAFTHINKLDERQISSINNSLEQTIKHSSIVVLLVNTHTSRYVNRENKSYK